MAVETNKRGPVNYWSMNYCLSASPTGLKRSFVIPERMLFYLNLGYEIYDEPFIEVGINILI
jgi:hypothetical protein